MLKVLWPYVFDEMAWVVFGVSCAPAVGYSAVFLLFPLIFSIPGGPYQNGSNTTVAATALIAGIAALVISLLVTAIQAYRKFSNQEELSKEKLARKRKEALRGETRRAFLSKAGLYTAGAVVTSVLAGAAVGALIEMWGNSEEEFVIDESKEQVSDATMASERFQEAVRMMDSDLVGEPASDSKVVMEVFVAVFKDSGMLMKSDEEIRNNAVFEVHYRKRIIKLNYASFTVLPIVLRRALYLHEGLHLFNIHLDTEGIKLSRELDNMFLAKERYWGRFFEDRELENLLKKRFYWSNMEEFYPWKAHTEYLIDNIGTDEAAWDRLIAENPAAQGDLELPKEYMLIKKNQGEAALEYARPCIGARFAPWPATSCRFRA